MFVAQQADELIAAVTYVKENLSSQIETLADKIVHAFQHGNKVILMGNGGSASDAQHIAAEFVGRFKKNVLRCPPLRLTPILLPPPPSGTIILTTLFFPVKLTDLPNPEMLSSAFPLPATVKTYTWRWALPNAKDATRWDF